MSRMSVTLQCVGRVSRGIRRIYLVLSRQSGYKDEGTEKVKPVFVCLVNTWSHVSHRINGVGYQARISITYIM